MPRSAAIHALAKVMIGLAWEDGHVTPDEINLLKDIIFRMPEVTADDWEHLNLYWVTPIQRPQLALLERELIQTLQPQAAKQAVHTFLEAVVKADGQVSSEEAALLRDLGRDLDRSDPRLLEDLGKLLQNAVPKRADDLASAPNRVDYIQDLMDKRVMVKLREQYGDDIIEHLGLEADELQKLALTGELMGCVAYADYKIDDNEIETMYRILQSDWSLHEEHAAIIVEFAVDSANQALDYPRLFREFYEATVEQERIDFLEVLFDIAASHEGISDAETAEIAKIARALKIEFADFDAARQRALRMAAAF